MLALVSQISSRARVDKYIHKKAVRFATVRSIFHFKHYFMGGKISNQTIKSSDLVLFESEQFKRARGEDFYEQTIMI